VEAAALIDRALNYALTMPMETLLWRANSTRYGNLPLAGLCTLAVQQEIAYRLCVALGGPKEVAASRVYIELKMAVALRGGAELPAEARRELVEFVAVQLALDALRRA
jgi:hypothetical protein